MRYATKFPVSFALLLTAAAFVLLLPAQTARAQSPPVTTIENAAGNAVFVLRENNALAVGSNTTATIADAMAWGNGASATNYNATAWGLETEATGPRTTAWGNQTLAAGYSTTAWGLRTTARGRRSTAFGQYTTATGYSATAMGVHTTASGFGATAMGRGTVAANRYSLSVGKWNRTNTDSTGGRAVFVVGNGSGGNDRSDALVLDLDGNLTIAGTLTESSDRRLKEDIAPLGGVLQKLEGVEPVVYRFREGTGHPTDLQVGLIAQDVQQAFPKLVTKGADGYLSVSYTKFTAVLLKAVQEQQAQIERQQAQIAALQAQPSPGAPLAGMLPVAGLLLSGLFVGGVIAWRRRRGPLG